MKVTCIVDDAALPGSGFMSEHGLSFLVEVMGRRVLFDTGNSGKVILNNLKKAGVEPEGLSAIVISHSHRDHTGGLAMLLERSPDIPVYAHPAIFTERLSLRGDRLKDVGLPISQSVMILRVQLYLSDEPVEVVPGVWTTGEITHRPEPEGRSERHFIRAQGRLMPDNYKDDMALVVEREEDVVLICGCCHAGILNTVYHVEGMFNKPIKAIFGGLHLQDADENHLARVVEVLKDYGPPRIYANHCTGNKALNLLREAFGDKVIPFPAGSSETL